MNNTKTILDTLSPHFEMDYVQSAEMAGFRLLDKNDWYDNKAIYQD